MKFYIFNLNHSQRDCEVLGFSQGQGFTVPISNFFCRVFLEFINKKKNIFVYIPIKLTFLSIKIFNMCIMFSK
jgi:hypothetical protein